MQDDEEWTQEDTERFVRNMRQEQQKAIDQQSGSKPNDGPIWAGLMLGSLIIYGLYTGLSMRFTLWLATLLVVLALGNKAIQ